MTAFYIASVCDSTVTQLETAISAVSKMVSFLSEYTELISQIFLLQWR